MSGPPGHSLQIALHKLTPTLRAEAALQTSGELWLDGELAIGTWQRTNKVETSLRCRRGLYTVVAAARADASYIRFRP